MRAILDANLLIRFLISSTNLNRSVDVIVRAGISQRFTLVLTQELRREVVESVVGKAWLRARISGEEAAAILTDIEAHGELLPTMMGPPPPLCRDPRDDYLLAYAESGRADYLVTDDGDLLVLNGMFPFRILSPPDFLTILRGHGLI